MNSTYNKIIISLILVIFTLFSSCQKNDSQIYNITLEQGVDVDGHPTNIWKNALQLILSNDDFNDMISTSKKLTESEIEWMELIQSKLSYWENSLEHLAIPFPNIDIPNNITIVCGNLGDLDAFVIHDLGFKIFFNLSVLNKAYGNAESDENNNRIDRLFAHEYTHLLHNIWFKKNPYNSKSSLDEALRICLVEGIGHYRSISNKWRDENGNITEHSQNTLMYLEPLFVDRLVSIKNSTDLEAIELMQDLSMGQFNRKWGALTVALWLVKESSGDDRNLIKWIESGPNGILDLALKNLPDELKIKLKSGLEL